MSPKTITDTSLMIRLKGILCIFVLSYLSTMPGLRSKIDSVKALLKTASEDTVKVTFCST